MKALLCFEMVILIPGTQAIKLSDSGAPPCSGGLRGPGYSCYDEWGKIIKFHYTTLASDRMFKHGGLKKSIYKHLLFFFSSSYPKTWT